MTDTVHTLTTAGGKEIPHGTEAMLTKVNIRGHINVQIKLPGQTSFLDLGDLPIVDGIVTLPLKLVFMCHANEDKTFVEHLADDLTQEGYLIWLDKRNLLPGDDWKTKIEEAIEKADYVLVFLSKHSCYKTGYVQREIKYALEQRELRPASKRYIIPILLEASAPPREFKDIHYLHIGEDHWFEKLKLALAK